MPYQGWTSYADIEVPFAVQLPDSCPRPARFYCKNTLPSSADLQERIDGLRDKSTALAELDKQIADALDGEEFDAENCGRFGLP
ncbi:hypothetical protein MTO96_001175 [Rhipicephalus appendiculatus]